MITEKTLDREKHQIRFERRVGATPAQVFAAWTDPEQVKAWWDPTGTPLVECTIDLRPQGPFRFVTAGHAHPFEGVYEVIERPRLLRFRAMGALGVVTFEERDGATLMSVSIQSPDAAHFETFLKVGVDQGTSVTLDNLVRRFAKTG